MDNVRKVVILGGSGFIGNALLKRFRKEDGVSVREYASSTLDLFSANAWKRLCELVNRETILIVASRSRQKGNSPEALLEDMSMITNIARCLAKHPVKKCLLFSSPAVYGEGVTNLNITEETPARPTSFYGIAKLTGDSILERVTEDHKIPFVVLRPSMVYGPGNATAAYGPTRFIHSILQEKKVYLFGDGSEHRDYLYLDDLAEITLSFANTDHSGTFNVATGKSHSFRQIIRLLRKIVDQKFEVVKVKRDRPKVSLRINPRKLFTVLPRFRFTSLDEGLKSAYASCFRHHLLT